MGTAGVAEETSQLGLYSWEDGSDLYNHTQLYTNWSIIDSKLLKKTWEISGDEAEQVRFLGTVNLSDSVLTIRYGTADTEDRLNIKAGGTVNWGSGGVTTDTNLYRAGTSILSTDSTLRVTSGSVQFLNGTVTFTAQSSPTNKIDTNALFGINRNAGGTALNVISSAGTAPTLSITSEGDMNWSSGTSVSDASIYRSGSAELTIDANVIITGSVSLGSPSSTGWNVSNVTPGVKTYDAESVSVYQLADIVGNLINDLKDNGILGA
jgi:hypothetical protein